VTGHPAEFGLTPDALRAAAERKAGASDYGSDSYKATLEVLLHSIATEANLNETGLGEIRDRIVAALANRLTVVAWEKANPEAATAPVEAPIVILGLPRTGSSILHETLAAAPGMRTPLIWEVKEMSLVHEVTDADTDDRIKEIEAAIERKNRLAPGYAAIHYENPLIPMECVALLVLDLVTVQFSTIAYTPGYRQFLLHHDAHASYDWHRRGLRYLQAAKSGKRWVLKAPMHSLYLEALLDTYPDARLIQTHRDPVRSLGSLCSLHETLRSPFSDQVRMEEQAPDDIAYTAAVIQRAVDFRRDHPEQETRFHDVAFRNFISDPEATLSGIYAHCGMEFDDVARKATLDYIKNRPREKYGKHSYTLEQFGLSAGQIRPMFADYAQRFEACL
jgi:hypothetical protein